MLFDGKCGSNGGVYKISPVWFEGHFGGPVIKERCGKVVEDWTAKGSGSHSSYQPSLISKADISDRATFISAYDCSPPAAGQTGAPTPAPVAGGPVPIVTPSPPPTQAPTPDPAGTLGSSGDLGLKVHPPREQGDGLSVGAVVGILLGVTVLVGAMVGFKLLGVTPSEPPPAAGGATHANPAAVAYASGDPNFNLQTEAI